MYCTKQWQHKDSTKRWRHPGIFHLLKIIPHSMSIRRCLLLDFCVLSSLSFAPYASEKFSQRVCDLIEHIRTAEYGFSTSDTVKKQHPKTITNLPSCWIEYTPSTIQVLRSTHTYTRPSNWYAHRRDLVGKRLLPYYKLIIHRNVKKIFEYRTKFIFSWLKYLNKF